MKIINSLEVKQYQVTVVHILLDDHEHDWQIFDFAPQFDQHSFRQSRTDWSFHKGMQYVYKHIFAGIQTPIDKHAFHNNIVSSHTWNCGILSLQTHCQWFLRWIYTVIDPDDVWWTFYTRANWSFSAKYTSQKKKRCTIIIFFFQI